MQIRVLGCSGSIAAGSRTTAFLVDDEVLIDAGTGVGDLTLDEMVRIDHIFVSQAVKVRRFGVLTDSYRVTVENVQAMIDAVVEWEDLRSDVSRRLRRAAGKDRTFSVRRHGVPPV